MSWSDAAVRVAVALLPRRLRETYREQWSADLRDADEVGIRRADIARGALAFAVSVDRPVLEGLRSPGEEGVRRRSRLAVALVLSTALLAVTDYANRIVSFGSVTNAVQLDFVMFLLGFLNSAFVVLAPLAALAIVSVTRDTPGRVRLGVWILALASTAPLVQQRIDQYSLAIDNIFLSLGSIAYPVAAALIVVGVATLWRAVAPASHTGTTPRVRRLATAAAGALVVWGLVAAGLGAAIQRWAAREPLVFGMDITPETQAMYDEWLMLKVSFEQLVDGVFLGVGIGGAALGVVVIVVGLRSRSSRRAVISTAIAAVCVVLIALAALYSFLTLGTASFVPPARPDILAAIGRIGLASVVLVTVGEVRLANGPRAPRYARVAGP
jgi:hypothetical protein